MMTLWIDNKHCDIAAIPTLPLNFELTSLTKVEGARSGRTIELVLPATPANNAIFGSSRDIFASKRFNMEHHTARIEKDGMEIFSGTAYLLVTTVKASLSGDYTIRISEGGAEWIDNVVYGSLANLKMPFSGRLNLVDIAKSWEGDESVRFLPIYRGNYTSRYSSSSALPVERVLLTDDYHPFISVADMVKAMFAESGYKLRSDFFDSEMGRSLYISGDYTRTNNAVAKAKCDFLARRATTGSATADFSGRVYASNAFATHTVGAIVDTADPQAVDENGVAMSDTFCTNNSFTKNSAGNICFTPKVTTRVGFLLHLEYTTEYSILSRERLRGFDVIEGMYGERIEIALANNCKDYRTNPSQNHQYRAIVFDHIDGREYRLEASGSSGIAVNIASWSSRSALVVTPASPITSLKLLYRDSASGDTTWRAYTDDWALYAGYIEEQGEMDVEMEFRIAPQDVTAGDSLVLDNFWFGGAKQGMRLTLSTNTSLRPYFTSVPGYDSPLEFKDVAPRSLRQVDLLTALGEMFNLAFYTDRQRKEVVIEPLEALYEESEVMDWSSRIDHSKGIAIADCGLDLPQDFVLSYLEEDSVTQQFNSQNDTRLGYWSFRNPLYGTKRSTRKVGNTLFTTTLNTSDIISSAPSASIIQVGNIETEVGVDEAFTPRIVRYLGMRALPEGESWGGSTRLDSYPYAAFIDDSTINLCFEDRNDIEGLHHYYLPMLHRQRDGVNITLDLHLSTAEIATLFTADGLKPSLRRRFRFNIQGESSLFRLAKIERWNTESNIVRCSFEQELNH